MTLENQLLTRFARLHISQEDYKVIQSMLSNNVDWSVLIEKATWQRLLPILSHHLLSKELAASTPQPILDKLKTISYSSLARNIILQNELSHFLSLLNEHTVPTIVLKGAALLGNVYEDIALRPMSDIDLLVHPENINQAVSIALSQGYELIEEFDRNKSVESTSHHPPYLKHPEKKVRLEIHKHIVDSDGPYCFNLAEFWSRAQKFSVLDTPTLTLSPEDHLIHFCIHFILDRRYQSHHALGQLCDISELIRYYRNSLDWNLIENVAITNHLSSGLFFVFYTCHQMLEAPVPVNTLEKLRPPDYDSSTAKLFIERRIFENKPWLVHDLVSHDSNYSTTRAYGSAFVRFLQSGLVFKRKGYPVNDVKLNIQLIQDKLMRLTRAIFKPSELKEDLRLDRWLHDLYD